MKIIQQPLSLSPGRSSCLISPQKDDDGSKAITSESMAIIKNETKAAEEAKQTSIIHLNKHETEMSEKNKDHLIESQPQKYLTRKIDDIQMSSQSRKLTDSPTFSESERNLNGKFSASPTIPKLGD